MIKGPALLKYPESGTARSSDHSKEPANLRADAFDGGFSRLRKFGFTDRRGLGFNNSNNGELNAVKRIPANVADLDFDPKETLSNAGELMD
jgi:hypothetical protein